MLQIPDSPIPCILVSPAPHEFSPVEPKSPFDIELLVEPASPRPQHLLPPPATNHRPRPERHGQLSPLSPSRPGGGKGLDRARFEAMLKASKERSAMVGAKKPIELRKEIAVKAQKVKQFERRARFLSKLAEPPSPSAADLPVTPPDSPAIFHFTLPSPGLESPLDVFENITPELYMERIEQVDFRLPYQRQAEAARRRRPAVFTSGRGRPLPSLDQISKRLGNGPVPVNLSRAPSPEDAGSRLPSFLQSRLTSSPASGTDQNAKRPRFTLPNLALRTSKPISAAIRTPTPINAAFPTLPPSPKSPLSSKLQIITTICPPTPSKSSPTEFTEGNIMQFDSEHPVDVHRDISTTVEDSQPPSRRAQVTRDMFSKLSRRAAGFSGAAACGVKAQDDLCILSLAGTEEKLRRRTSAPAELSAVQRGARHPVLEMPGGF